MLKRPEVLDQFSEELATGFGIVDELTEAYFSEPQFFVTLPSRAYRENVGLPISNIPGNFESSAAAWAKNMFKLSVELGKPALDTHGLDMAEQLLDAELAKGIDDGTTTAEQVPTRVGQIIAKTLYFEAIKAQGTSPAVGSPKV